MTPVTPVQVLQSQDYLIGSIGVSGKTKWDVLDGVVRRLFKVREGGFGLMMMMMMMMDTDDEHGGHNP